MLVLEREREREKVKDRGRNQCEMTHKQWRPTAASNGGVCGGIACAVF